MYSWLDDFEDNTTLDVKFYDAIDVLKKLNKQKTLYYFVVESFC